jgi:hypothetical protein
MHGTVLATLHERRAATRLKVNPFDVILVNERVRTSRSEEGRCPEARSACPL